MNLQELLRTCKTDKQAREIIKRTGLTIIKDDTEDIGGFSVWVDDYTRIYKTHMTKEYIVQTWHKVSMTYSGIPTFFATGL